MEHKWFVVTVHTGKEFAAKQSLEKHLEIEHFDKVSEVVVPVYKETLYKDGKKKQVERKSFPGYLYIKMQMDKDSMRFVTATPYVTQFVRQGESDPRPLSEKEIKNILNRDQESADFMPVQIDFDVGQKVLIIDGPFNNFSGTIKAIYTDKKKVCVNVEIFGRITPVEIDYFKVKKN